MTTPLVSGWRLCHEVVMDSTRSEPRLHRRLIDSLYTEAMLLADEARSYFDEAGRAEREALDPLVRVGFSCESLKVTTRLMHVIAWLLTQRAVDAGELRQRDALDPSRRLGEAPMFDADLVSALPIRARQLIAASADLHRRVGLLDQAQETPAVAASPVHNLHDRLALAF
jgi:regulator of CtrA degradation